MPGSRHEAAPPRQLRPAASRPPVPAPRVEPLRRPQAGQPAAQPTRQQSGEPAAEGKKSKPDLTINKILAGAGAAATTAIFGSYFGATGTVAGAAIGSVVSTVVTTVYQRSLDRTKDTVLKRIRSTDDATAILAAPQGAGDDPQATVLLGTRTPDGRSLAGPAPSGHGRLSPRTRRRLLTGLAATAAAFAIGLAVITGIEWAKGSPISGGSGTSVGSVVGSQSTSTEEPTPAEPSVEPGTTDESGTPTESVSPSTERRAPFGAGDGQRSGGEPSATSTPEGSSTTSTAPTSTPGPLIRLDQPAG